LTIDQLRDRLKGAAAPKKKERPSIASAVRALLPEVRMKRAAGWTWEQIADAMYDDEAKASAIRTAYNRLLKPKGRGKGRKSSSSGGRAGGGPDMPVAEAVVRQAGAQPVGDNHPPRPAANTQSLSGLAQLPARPPAPSLFGKLTDDGFRLTNDA
jgi:hypothetical protein